ncbi:MAG: FtsX-like permease family protein [Bdellovibrionales bacterium]|nr:FtsX-like permease family protein [Bdellovibrionales bacterium]
MAWYLIRRYLFSNQTTSIMKTMTRLSLLGVTLGVMTMIVVLSVMTGFSKIIRDRLLSIEPHLTVAAGKDMQASAEDSPEGGGGMVAASDDGGGGLATSDIPVTRGPNPTRKSLEGFFEGAAGTEISSYERQDVIIRTMDGLFSGGVAKGLDENGLKLFRDGLQRSKQKAGGAVNEGITVKAEVPSFSPDLKANEIIIGADLARGLGVFEDDEVVLLPPESLLAPKGEVPQIEKVKVRALLRTNIPDIDGHLIFYRKDRTLKRFQGAASRTYGFEIRLADPDAVTQWIEPLKVQGWKVETWQTRNSALFYSLKMERMLFSIFLGLTIFISSFSIVIVLVMLSVHKRREIGTLMALGLSPARTQVVFTQLGLMLSGAGVFAGLILGLGICLIGRNLDLDFLPDIYYDTRIPFELEPSLMTGIMIIAVLVGLVAAWIPARINSRLSPIEALRG